MSESRPHHDPAKTENTVGEQIAYPTDHVVAIFDTAEQLRSATTALTGEGFLDSELNVSAGEGVADALSATTGRTGWADLAMRFTSAIGLPNDETLIKRGYEDALRDGHYLLMVRAADDERKERAARIAADHGGHFIHFFGRLKIQVMRP